MFKELINKEVTVIVSSKTEMLLEYTGILSEENETSIKLKNANISVAMLNFQKNFFGSGMGAYKQNIDELIINKSYIISCNNK